MWAMPRVCELYLGICLASEEKDGKPSVRVVEKCPDIPVAVAQYTYTHKQYTDNTMRLNTQNGHTHNNKIT
jgi:hypothetical protein